MKQECKQGARCCNHRKCDTCALVRLHKIKEQIRQNTPTGATITYAVIRPLEEYETPKIRKRLSRIVSKKSDGHIWTVETGTTCHGLHINFIISGDHHITQEELAPHVLTASDIWVSQIPNRDLETVTKYILKPESIPQITQYAGNTYGRAGSMKHISAYLKNTTNGAASLACQNEALTTAGLPITQQKTGNKALDNLPALKNVVANPYQYHRIGIDYYGNIIKNPTNT